MRNSGVIKTATVMIIVLLICKLTACKNDVLTPPPIDYSSITNISYADHIQPLLNRSCATAGCHFGAAPPAGLDLSSWNRLIKGSTFGEAVIPHKPAKSLMTMLFDGAPLRKAHPSLGNNGWRDDEILFLKRWINEGARGDSGQVPFANSVHRLYVPNQGENTVAIIDIDNLVVIKYITVGTLAIEGPHYIASDDNYWYVSLISSRQVWKFDVGTDTLVGVAQLPGSPALLALTNDGQKLYVSQFSAANTNTVMVVNTQTMSVEKQIAVWSMPHGIRMNHSGTTLYVANMMSDNISVVDVATDSVVATVPLAADADPFGPPKYMPMEIAVSPDDSVILITCSETQEVRMMHAGSNAIVDSFHVGDQPWHLQFTPDGALCYVSNRRGNSVSVIHIPMRHVMETISSISPVYFDYPHGCDLSPDGRYVFISNENARHRFLPRYTTEFVGNVTVIDNALGQIIKVLEVGRMPTGISVRQ